MAETNKARALVATLRDALHQLEGTLGRTREGVDEIASQAERIRDSVAALCELWQREDTWKRNKNSDQVHVMRFRLR
jgi:hypothetical protein